MTRYEYSVLDKELQEIRLLDLLPGAFDAPIRGILRTKSFTENTVPEYEALSYTWGSTENPQTIQIGDAPFDITTIEVTRNFAQALPYLRLETEPRVLWIDAICVNQQDLKERGSQVKRMPDLYSKARRVVVWLGPEGVQSIIAMNLLQDMGSKIVVDWNAYNYTSVSGSTQGAEIEPYKDEEARLTYSQVEMSAIFEILQRSWFERLWIVQEICLAPPNTILQCGKTCISWTEFSNAVFLLHTKRWKWYDPLQEQSIRARLINIVAFLRTKYRTFNTLRGLLEDTKKQQCSDPRDRIYAILSLATDLNFEPDYTKSTNETFKAVMLSYLSSTRALDTVVSAGCQKKSGHGPSWVPDWSALPSLNPIPQHLAPGESEATFRCEGDMLMVQGIYVGKVSRAEPFLLSESIKRDYHSIAEEVRRVVLLVLAGLAGPESKFIKTNRVAALARTLIPNALAETLLPRRPK